MPKVKEPLRVPFALEDQRWERKGQLRGSGGWPGTEWRDNYIFYAELQFLYVVPKAQRVMFVDQHGFEYPMFLSDFNRLVLKHGVSRGGRAPGNWTFCKHGANYGICPAKDDPT